MTNDAAGRYANRILASLPPDELALLEPHFDHVHAGSSGASPGGGRANQPCVLPRVRDDLRGPAFKRWTNRGGGGDRHGRDGGLYPRHRFRTFRSPPARRCPRLASQAGRFATLVLAVTAQNVGCGQVHQVSERLARWLLTVKDLVGSPRFNLTQEFMAEMLATNRPTVTLAALTPSKAGLIRYARGRIEILDVRGLEDSACECYHTLRREYDGLHALASLGGD